MTLGTTMRTTIEQWLEEKNEQTAVYANGSDLIWRLFSTLPATYTLNQDGLVIRSPERMVGGMEYTLELLQDSTGNRKVTWGAYFRWHTDIEPELSTVPGALDVLKFYCDGTYMYGRLFFRQQQVD